MIAADCSHGDCLSRQDKKTRASSGMTVALLPNITAENFGAFRLAGSPSSAWSSEMPGRTQSPEDRPALLAHLKYGQRRLPTLCCRSNAYQRETNDIGEWIGGRGENQCSADAPETCIGSSLTIFSNQTPHVLDAGSDLCVGIRAFPAALVQSRGGFLHLIFCLGGETRPHAF